LTALTTSTARTTAPPFTTRGHVALLVCANLDRGALARILAKYATDDDSRKVHVIEYHRKPAPVRLANSFWAGFRLASAVKSRGIEHIVLVGGCCAGSKIQQVSYAIRALKGHIPIGGGVTITPDTADRGHVAGSHVAGRRGLRLLRRFAVRSQ
jgi:hypothetical protein